MLTAWPRMHACMHPLCPCCEQVVRGIIAQGGVVSLFGRGLATKITINGIQSSLFTILWKLGQDAYATRAARHDGPGAP